ncbi:MAG: biopolymer transporter ExbD [Alphaproteobacteria bacterium]|nr:biopolymer transporter ExbD [Alphaproteobacteria bacterium]MDE2112389.1 biopolymer transporter ExbD [Alphaproteobacteria bacterium]MDE2495314.1 biopolymer transporter ExbD [Alphaproteobacteria bacterium]
MAALNAQTSGEHEEDELNSTINVVPLVDIMLVMLIIFLVTIPVIVHTVPLTLPNAINIPTQTKPENIVISVDKNENVYWNNEPVQYSDLRGRFEQALLRSVHSGTPLPEVHIRGDRSVRFQALGRVILACQQAGVPKVGFITEPRNDTQ